LARSSVYQYFDSTADLLLAVVEESFEEATAQLKAAMAGAGTPTEQVNAYVLAMLATATDETHRSIATLSGATLPESARSRVAVLHEEQERPLVAALAAMGIPDSEIVARLVQGLIGSATSQINRGVDRGSVTDATIRLIHAGLMQ
jgi:AcrR family transcriptional regulator